ncbi:MAG: VWA domain-containing protein [Planctomycetota bacterium]|nr:VWA domain-containing protein [Planctomycetota bacterium]
MNHIAFDNPWLLLIVPAAAAIAVAGSWRGLAGQPRRRTRLVLRSLAAVALALAAAAPSWRMDNARVRRVLLVDVSGSTAGEGAKSIDAILSSALSDLGPEDEFSVITFSSDVVCARFLSPLGPHTVAEVAVDCVRAVKSKSAVNNGPATDIGRAMRAALGEFADGQGTRQIMLVTDGLDTVGDALEAARAVAAQRAELYVAPLSAEPRDVRISRVSAPPFVDEGRGFVVSVYVTGTASGQVKVSLSESGSIVEEREVSVLRRAETTVTFHRPPLDSSFVRFTVGVAPADPNVSPGSALGAGPADSIGQNNSVAFTVFRGEKTRVLFLRDERDPKSAFEGLLEAAGGFHPVPVGRPGRGRGIAVEAVAGRAVIVVDSMSAVELGVDTMRALEELCKDGSVGLLVLGGPAGFGAGGFSGTILEKAMPVLCDPGSDIALALLLDASGSMDVRVDVEEAEAPDRTGDKRKKFAVAVDAVAETLTLLGGGDILMVTAFSGTPRLVYGPAPIKDATGLRKALAELTPSGPTRLAPPLREAVGTLKSQSKRKRHIMLVSDGETVEAESELAGVAKEARAAGITVTTLGIGGKPNEKVLQALTSQGENGRYVRVKSMSLLADSLREVIAREKEYVRESETPVNLLASSQAVAGLSKAPPARGHNRVRAKDGAIVHATLEKGEGSESPLPLGEGQGEGVDFPLLATRQYGLGKCGAFMSSFDAGWLEAWKGWMDVGAFAVRMIDAVTPDVAGGGARLRVWGEVRGGKCVVFADANNLAGEAGKSKYALRPEAFVHTNRGRVGPFPMSQTAPGVYEAALGGEGEGGGRAYGLLGDAGSYPVTVAERSTTERPVAESICGTGSIFVPFGAEWQVVGNSEARQRELADAAGGELVSLVSLRLPSAGSGATSAGVSRGSGRDSILLLSFLAIAGLVFVFAELAVAATAGVRGRRAL